MLLFRMWMRKDTSEFFMGKVNITAAIDSKCLLADDTGQRRCDTPRMYSICSAILKNKNKAQQQTLSNFVSLSIFTSAAFDIQGEKSYKGDMLPLIFLLNSILIAL